jgi:hypothetical protein
MNRSKLMSLTLGSMLAITMLGGTGFAKHKKKSTAASPQTTSSTSAASAAGGATTKPSMAKSSTSGKTTASSSEIASAKAKGMVWVNTESGVYHTGGKYYGTTKHGKFMSVADAQKAGYKAAKR